MSCSHFRLNCFAWLCVLLASFTVLFCAVGQVPNILNYQGRVAANGVNFTGTGQFKFALVASEGFATLWSNDGTSVNGSQPTAFVTLPVDKGLFSVLLGDSTISNMLPVNPGIFGNNDIRLRVWFNDGTNGFQQLTPDQRLASAGYSITAASAASANVAGVAISMNASSTAPFSPAATNVGAMYLNTAEQKVFFSNGTNWVGLAPQAPPVYRWAVWHAYDNANGSWFFNNETNLLGGVAPSAWTDGGAYAYQISSNKQVQASLFNKRATVSPSSVVWAETYLQSSSTDGKMIGALFRVRNKTGSAITWTPSFFGTCYGVWGENLSVAVNGQHSYAVTSSSYANQSYTVTLSIPANRVSTVVFIAGSAPPVVAGASGIYSRSAVLAFRNNSLSLPAGLEFVDDLDTATGGYNQ